MNEPKIGFELQRIRVGFGNILPVRQIKEPDKRIVRYKTILASIREVGMIEPLMVYPQKGKSGMYLLMDGHLRFHALKELGETSAECLISTEDESFTYNTRISRLSPIQEHAMIKKAIQNDVSAEKIAAALSIRIADVQSSLRLLDGIHEEACDLLKDKGICPKALRALKKVSGVRQIEMAELMVSANNFSNGYAEALLLGTPKDQLLESAKPKPKGLSIEEVGRLEHEMESLEKDFKAVEASYGENILQYTLIKSYVKKLLENGKIVRFLSSRQPEIFAEFESIVAAETL